MEWGFEIPGDGGRDESSPVKSAIVNSALESGMGLGPGDRRLGEGDRDESLPVKSATVNLNWFCRMILATAGGGLGEGDREDMSPVKSAAENIGLSRGGRPSVGLSISSSESEESPVKSAAVNCILFFKSAMMRKT